MKISGAVFVQNFHELQQDHEVFLEDLAEQFEPLGFEVMPAIKAGVSDRSQTAAAGS